MDYKTILIDDEKGARESLKKMIEKHCPELEITATAGSVKEGKAKIGEWQADLIFLDIEMQDGSGFDLLQQLGDKSPAVIFVTAFDQFAIKAIKFSAIDYLLKPVNSEDLVNAVSIFKAKSKNNNLDERIKVLMENMQPDNNDKKIAFPEQDGLVFVHIKDIIRCHSDGSYSTIFMKDRKIMVTRTIGELDELLTESEPCFFRVHRSHIINLKFIKKYIKGNGGYAIMDDGAEIEISRRKKVEFIEAMMKF